MIVVSVAEFKANASKYLKLLANGESVRVTSHGHELVTIEKAEKAPLVIKEKPALPWGLYAGQIKMSDDFDDPLEEFAEYTED